RRKTALACSGKLDRLDGCADSCCTRVQRNGPLAAFIEDSLWSAVGSDRNAPHQATSHVDVGDVCVVIPSSTFANRVYIIRKKDKLENFISYRNKKIFNKGLVGERVDYLPMLSNQSLWVIFQGLRYFVALLSSDVESGNR